ncbi:amidohydrolase [Tamlana fucoidanivorans]|uniref:Omega-amidase YafV n=1 Tax=Allotamlana fucoidanivorans TaxID=2583814 RepID=A0A5C4SLR3_9FLAO|nr:amidohydrolase [Tamlana fucoidanivorans]TNJ44222.1 amidohydrolase [Tamlana fucoidanivorans]
MQSQLNIAVIQSDLVWENPKANRENFETKILGITKAVDIIVLPEMFTSGFTMNASKVAEPMEGATVSWMKQLAVTKGAAILGSLVISDEDKNYYNRLLFVEPSGRITTYNKRHTFTLVGEDKVYTSGDEKVLIDYKGWRICPLICYDLRFPVWARNVDNYDVLIYVANWPKPRITAWDALLKARAIENMSYCIGVNRVGVDGVNSVYSGHSVVYNVLGQEILKTEAGTETIQTITLEKRHIEAYRNKLKFLNDRDHFTIE